MVGAAGCQTQKRGDSPEALRAPRACRARRPVLNASPKSQPHNPHDVVLIKQTDSSHLKSVHSHSPTRCTKGRKKTKPTSHQRAVFLFLFVCFQRYVPEWRVLSGSAESDGQTDRQAVRQTDRQPASDFTTQALGSRRKVSQVRREQKQPWEARPHRAAGTVTADECRWKLSPGAPRVAALVEVMVGRGVGRTSRNISQSRPQIYKAGAPFCQH